MRGLKNGLAAALVLVCMNATYAQDVTRPAGSVPMIHPLGPTLDVTGRGSIGAVPDTAMLSLGAVQQAKDAQAAQEAVNRIVQEAINRIKEAGVDEAQIQTAGVSLYPVYSNEMPRPMGAGVGHEGAQEPQIVAYRASNTLQIEVRDLTKVGDVIDAAIGAGANQMHGLSYELRNDTAARRDALRRAVERARAEAEAVSAALGLALGEVVHVEVGDFGFRPPMPMMGRAMAMEAMAAPTPTEPGQVRVEATVSISYRLGAGAAAE